MANDIYGLTSDQVERIRRLLEQFEGTRLLQTDNIRRERPLARVVETYLAKTTSEITAAVSDTTTLTTLSGSIDDVTTTVTVADVSGMPADGSAFVITIDAEDMVVSGIDGTILTVSRGYDGTTGLAHTGGADVKKTVLTLGTGTAKIEKATESGSGNYTVSTLEQMDIVVYNASAVKVGARSLVELLREPISGVFVVTPPAADPCGFMEWLNHRDAADTTWTSPSTDITVDIEIIGDGAGWWDGSGAGAVSWAGGGGGAYALKRSAVIPANAVCTIDWGIPGNDLYSNIEFYYTIDGGTVELCRANNGNGNTAGIASGSLGDVTFNGGIGGTTSPGDYPAGGGGSGFPDRNGLPGEFGHATRSGLGGNGSGNGGIGLTPVGSFGNPAGGMGTFTIPTLGGTVDILLSSVAALMVGDQIYLGCQNGVTISAPTCLLNGLITAIVGSTITFQFDTFIDRADGANNSLGSGDTVEYAVAYLDVYEADAQTPGGGAGESGFFAIRPFSGKGRVRLSFGCGVTTVNGATGAVALIDSAGKPLPNSGNGIVTLVGATISGGTIP